MKSNINKKSAPIQRSYPQIKRLKDTASSRYGDSKAELIVLFTSEHSGVILHYSSDVFSNRTGQYEVGLVEQDFEIYHGDVTVHN